MDKSDDTTAFEQSYYLFGDEQPNQGPSWQRADWPAKPADEFTAALDGNWAAYEKTLAPKIEARAKAEVAKAPPTAPIAQSAPDTVKKATLDSVRALMMIRAYRMRGHLAADLDPLKLKEPATHPELNPASYGFTEADMDRPVFLDNV